MAIFPIVARMPIIGRSIDIQSPIKKEVRPYAAQSFCFYRRENPEV
jgi:hypothetical protein